MRYYYTADSNRATIYVGSPEEIQKTITYKPSSEKLKRTLDQAKNLCLKLIAQQSYPYGEENIFVMDIASRQTNSLFDYKSQIPATVNTSLIELKKIDDENEFIRAIDTEYYLHAEDDQHTTPVHLAAIQGFSRAIKLMAKQKYNMNTLTYSSDNLGQTPLHLAVRYGQVKSVRALLKFAADSSISTAGKWAYKPIELWKEYYNCHRDEPDTCQRVKEITESFPAVDSGKIVFHFEWRDEKYVIKDVDFSCHKHMNHESHFSQLYPDCFEKKNGGIYIKETHWNIRHKKSVNIIVAEYKAKIINKSYQEVFNEYAESSKASHAQDPLITTVGMAQLVRKSFEKEAYDINNLFIGDKHENATYGWLAGEMQKLKTNPPKFPHLLIVPDGYADVFQHTQDNRYKKAYDASRQCFEMKCQKELNFLYQTANHDLPRFAKVPPTSKKPVDLEESKQETPEFQSRFTRYTSYTPNLKRKHQETQTLTSLNSTQNPAFFKRPSHSTLLNSGGFTQKKHLSVQNASLEQNIDDDLFSEATNSI